MNPTLKILMVSEDVPDRSMGGLGQHVTMLARALVQAGHQVDFMGNNLVPHHGVSGADVPAGRFFPELDMKHVGWKEVPMGMYNPLRRPFIAWRFARAIRRRAEGYDVVHYHGHFPLLANHLPRSLNFVQTRHDQGSDCLTHVRFRNHQVCRESSPFSCAGCAAPRPGAVQRLVSAGAVTLYRALVARAFLRHKTIFVSELLRRNFSRTLGDAPWGRVIHNCVDGDLLRPLAEAPRPPSGRTEVFVAGKLYEPKGIAAFLELVCTRRLRGMRITVAGDGANEGELRERYGSESIVFLGWQSHGDTMRHMAAADIVVVPSLVEEAFGLVTLEGMALGKKVLALDRGATPELLKYQRYAGQLSLYHDLGALVDGVVGATAGERGARLGDGAFAAGISALLDPVLDCYRTGRGAWRSSSP